MVDGFNLPRVNLAGEGWRVVEAQSNICTRSLVDSDEEHHMLEEILEDSKPGLLASEVNFLLTTPFRYPPLSYGSRYGSKFESGIFYGSETVETALAEIAYYFFRFRSDSPDLDPVALSLERTAFRFQYQSENAADTTSTDFTEYRTQLEAEDYTFCQAIGASARKQSIDIIRFRSVRCPQRGFNLAILSLDPLRTTPDPPFQEAWSMFVAIDNRIEFRPKNRSRLRALVFKQGEL